MNWRARAECRDADPRLFFSNDPFDKLQALRICDRCKVRVECYDEDMAAPSLNDVCGIRGGLEEADRRLRWRRDHHRSRGTTHCACGCGEILSLAQQCAGIRYLDSRHRHRQHKRDQRARESQLTMEFA